MFYCWRLERHVVVGNLPLTFHLITLFFVSRERNRMHAKMTRDRKKCFISATEKAIEELEQELARMRSIVQSLDDSSSSSSSTPATDKVCSQDTILDVANIMVTPELTARPSPEDTRSSNNVPLRSCSHEPSPKRVCHGFLLDG